MNVTKPTLKKVMGNLKYSSTPTVTKYNSNKIRNVQSSLSNCRLLNRDIHFGMAAMAFLYNGLFINQFNLPRVNLVFTLKSAKVQKY